MDREETKKVSVVMEHYENGGDIECRALETSGNWMLASSPVWNFYDYEYRIARRRVTYGDKVVIVLIATGESHKYIVSCVNFRQAALINVVTGLRLADTVDVEAEFYLEDLVEDCYLCNYNINIIPRGC